MKNKGVQTYTFHFTHMAMTMYPNLTPGTTMSMWINKKQKADKYLSEQINKNNYGKMAKEE